MKTKTVSKETKTILVSLVVPADYNFLAIQPFGEINLFTNKPVLYSEIEEEGQAPVEYWENQGDEISLTDTDEIMDLNRPKNWRNTVRPVVDIEGKANQIADKLITSGLFPVFSGEVTRTIAAIIKKELGLDNSK